MVRLHSAQEDSGTGAQGGQRFAVVIGSMFMGMLHEILVILYAWFRAASSLDYILVGYGEADVPRRISLPEDSHLVAIVSTME